MQESYPLFFFNDTATTEIYTLSLHDALPIYCTFCATTIARGANRSRPIPELVREAQALAQHHAELVLTGDRKSTRLNSSHGYISYAVFCLKKKKKKQRDK